MWHVYFWVDNNRNQMQYVTIDAVSEREARRQFRACKHGGKTITAVEPGTPDRVRVFG